MSTPTVTTHQVPLATEDDRARLRTVTAASVIGATIEWYDFFLYATAAGLVFDKLFFPETSGFVGTLLAFATFAVGFVMRPLGGLFFGHIGDRIGRKTTLAVTMFLMGGATALMGLLPTHDQVGYLAPVLLILLRIVQGFAIGGEWAGAVLLAVEHSPNGQRSRYGSYPQIGLAIGLALGTGVFALLSVVLDDRQFLTWGWRVAFLLSVVLVAIGLVIRLKVDETPAFDRVRELSKQSTVPLRTLFAQPVLRRRVVLGLLSRWGEGAAFNTWAVFAISYATSTLTLPRVSVLIAVTVAAGLMAVIIPLVGARARGWDLRRVYIVGMAAYGVLVFPVFALFGTRNIWLFAIALVAVFGVAHAIFYAVQGTLYASLFPPEVRYTGLSFVYQFSGIYASGITPLIVTALVGVTGGPWAACGYLVATAVISVVATSLIRDDDLTV